MTGVVRLDRRVVHHEKNKVYDSIVVAIPRHKVYDCLVGVSWSVEPGLKSQYLYCTALHHIVDIDLNCLCSDYFTVPLITMAIFLGPWTH